MPDTVVANPGSSGAIFATDIVTSSVNYVLQKIAYGSTGVANLVSTALPFPVASASSGFVQISGTPTVTATAATNPWSSAPGFNLPTVSVSSGLSQVSAVQVSPTSSIAGAGLLVVTSSFGLLTQSTQPVTITSGTVTISGTVTVLSASSGLVQTLTSGTLIVVNASSGLVQISGTVTVLSASSGLIQISGIPAVTSTSVLVTSGSLLNVASWLGSTNPIVGQKSSTASIPVILSSDYRILASAATLTNVAGSTASVTILTTNDARKFVTIFNDSQAPIYLKYGSAASTTSFTYKVGALTQWEMPQTVYTGLLAGVGLLESTVAGTWRVTEI